MIPRSPTDRDRFSWWHVLYVVTIAASFFAGTEYGRHAARAAYPVGTAPPSDTPVPGTQLVILETPKESP